MSISFCKTLDTSQQPCFRFYPAFAKLPPFPGPSCYSVGFPPFEDCALMLTMQGKNAVVFGVANKRSIAWAIAQSLSQSGAKLAITYQNERMKAEAHDLISALPGAEPFQCDVSNDADIDSLFAQ